MTRRLILCVVLLVLFSIGVALTRSGEETPVDPPGAGLIALLDDDERRERVGLVADRLLVLARARSEKPAPACGSDRSGRIVFCRDWRRGFLTGALWRAAELTGRESIPREARSSTRRLIARGGLDEANHDLGFIWGRSLQPAIHAVCPPDPGSRGDEDCRSYRAALRTAARELDAFRAREGQLVTAPAGVCSRCSSDERMVIIDSEVNAALLLPVQSAAEHIRLVDSELIDPAGIVTQAAFLAPDGQVRRRVNLQGLPSGIWSRGQAWAVYAHALMWARTGDRAYAREAARLRDVFLAEPAADGREAPPYDLRADAGAPKDISALAILAAAQRHLDPPGTVSDLRRHLVDRVLRITGRDGRVAQTTYIVDDDPRDDDAEWTWTYDFLLEALDGFPLDRP